MIGIVTTTDQFSILNVNSDPFISAICMSLIKSKIKKANLPEDAAPKSFINDSLRNENLM